MNPVRVVSLLAVAVLLSSDDAVAQSCYQTQIRAPSPYLGNGGETIVMVDGSVWTEHSYQYLYLYEYNPSVTLCPSAGVMLLNDKRFSVTPVGGSAKPPQARAQAPQVIESNIDGEFEGWSGETIFKLANGQIWQQSEYAYTYHYAYSPRVLLVNVSGRYVMQVDGVRGKIGVRRLR